MNNIYTIGYAGFSIDEFITELKKHNITCLIDVRSKPYSGYHKDYNKESLITALQKNDILYRNYNLEFGAWQSDESYYTKVTNKDDTYYLDFIKYRQSSQFKNGYNKIVAGMNLGYVFAFMCSEIEPINCHRNIMVAKAFHDEGYNVLNIVPKNKGSIQTQEGVENQMALKYKRKVKDINDNDEKVNKLYQLTNEKIGHKQS